MKHGYFLTFLTIAFAIGANAMIVISFKSATDINNRAYEKQIKNMKLKREDKSYKLYHTSLVEKLFKN